MANKGSRMSGPMVLVAALANGRRNSHGLAGSIAERTKAVTSRIGSNGSGGMPGFMERAGEVLSAAAVAVAVIARLRSESNGDGD